VAAEWVEDLDACIEPYGVLGDETMEIARQVLTRDVAW